MRSYRNVILDEARFGGLPVGYWPLDEVNGTTANDEMALARGTGNAGTIGGTATLGATGPINGEASRGVLLATGQVNIGTTPAALQFGSTWTLEAWVYRTGNESFGGIIVNSASFSRLAANYAINMESTTGQPQVTCRNNSGNLLHPNVMPLNQWSHVVATRDGTSYTITLNGVTASGTATTGAVSYSTQTTLIGAWTTGSGKLSGRYAHVAMYDYVLDIERRLAHHEAGRYGVSYPIGSI